MELEFTNNLEVNDKTLDAVVENKTVLMIVDSEAEIVHLPEWEYEEFKRIDDSIISNIERKGIKCYKIIRGGGSTVVGPGDIPFALISPLGLDITCQDILKFLVSYFKEAGFQDSIIDLNDIMVNGKKVVGITSEDFPRFGMRITAAIITLTDHSETFRDLYSQFFDNPTYKMPYYIPLDRDKLIKSLKEYFESRGCC